MAGLRTEPARQHGTVRSLHPDKGFGFIRANDGTEYFFHKSAAPEYDSLERGSAVTFTIAAGNQKGPRAEDVARA